MRFFFSHVVVCSVRKVLLHGKQAIAQAIRRCPNARLYTELKRRSCLAREGGQLDQEDRYTSYTDEKTIVKTLTMKRWKQQNPNFNQSDSLHKLNRPEQVILFRMRTRQNRLDAHMYSKFKFGESRMCPYNADIMTAEHLLQNFELHDIVRRDVCPEPTPLRDKMYGNLQALERTAAFVRATSISV